MENFIEWGYVGLFLASFIAATIIPLSSEIVLSLLLANEYSLAMVLGVATAGNWLGGMTGYGLGRLGNWSLLNHFFGIRIDQMIPWQNRMNQWKSILAFFCWLPGIGDLIAVALGFFKISLIPVGLWMLIGKLLRYFVWAILTYWGLEFV